MGLVVRMDSGELVRERNWTKAGLNTPSSAIRAHHKQMMQRAAQTMEELPIERRFISGLTFSLPWRQYDQALKIVDDAMKSILLLTKDQTDKEAEETFQLNFQLFPLTRPQPKENEK